jgi:PAS domain S-box-containing protein
MGNDKFKRELNENEYYKQSYEDLNTILATTFDFISFADEKGVFIRLSKDCEKIFGVGENELIGLTCYEAERLGIVDRSITAMVLESKDKVLKTQTTPNGKTFLVTGIPVFDDKGNLKRILNISKDITEFEKLNNRLAETKELLKWYQQEMQSKQEIDKDFIYSESSSMKDIVALINQVANVDATVLLLGETGVGKNIIAKKIHGLSGRREKPFVHINCGAIPENLLESELFGYDEGAFTGATKGGKKGLFEVANGGTIFLDEIVELSIHLQAKLLHVLEDNEIYKLGSIKPTKINVRILAATNKDLKMMVEGGKFREDLYYRLNVLPIFIPPLRERKEDIPLLINFFLNKYNNKYYKNKELTTNAYDGLSRYEWPGNIRELENVVERLTITTDYDVIDIREINELIYQSNKNNVIKIDKLIPLKQVVEMAERELLLKAIKEHKTTRKIAEALEISQSSVVKKIKKLGLRI